MSVSPRTAPHQHSRPTVWLGRAVLVVVGLALALGCLDLGFRVARPVQAEQLLPLPYHQDDLRRIADGGTYIQFDQELGWSLRPGVVQQAGPVVYQANSVGLHALREYMPEPRPGIRRIAAFGDSSTHCDEVNNADCWTEPLEAAWPEAEILNYGVSGFGPDQP